MKKVKLYYDDECPFCKEYSKYIELRKQCDIELCNARDNLKKIEEFRVKGYDINNGMIVEIEDDSMLYLGADAAKILDSMIAKKGFIDKSMSFIVKLPLFNSIIYPIIKAIRIVLLKLLGRDYHL